MKKHFLCIASMLVLALTANCAFGARTTTNASLASAIRLYKAKNYSQSYVVLNNYVKKDSSNALAYYYLAMSCAQVGKKSEAIENYEKAASLATPNGQLEKFAQKGRTCLEAPDRCNEEDNMSKEERFIKGSFGSGFSEAARGTYEKHKIENMMRQMNRDDSISPRQFKDYKDFSSEVPTNDEIVSAIKTLQKAGLGDFISMNNNSMLMNNSNNNYDMLNVLLGTGSSNLNPQLIQSLLTNQMSTGF